MWPHNMTLGQGGCLSEAGFLRVLFSEGKLLLGFLSRITAGITAELLQQDSKKLVSCAQELVLSAKKLISVNVSCKIHHRKPEKIGVKTPKNRRKTKKNRRKNNRRKKTGVKITGGKKPA